MTEVYRIQDEEGHGPYTYLGMYNWTIRSHTNETGHPSPHCFGEFSENDLREFESQNHYLCGFESLEKLKAWFDESELKRLTDHQYHIYVVQAVRVWYGNKQIVFIPNGVGRRLYENEQETRTGPECIVLDGAREDVHDPGAQPANRDDSQLYGADYAQAPSGGPGGG